MVVNHCYLGRDNDKVLKFYMNDFFSFHLFKLPPSNKHYPLKCQN